MALHHQAGTCSLFALLFSLRKMINDLARQPMHVKLQVREPVTGTSKSNMLTACKHENVSNPQIAQYRQTYPYLLYAKNSLVTNIYRYKT